MAKRAKTRFSVLRAVLFLFVSLMLGFGIYSWNARSLMGNRLPMPFGYGCAVVLSGSMEPALSVNDLVLVRQTQEISIGDIVVYQSGGSLIIHRVTAVNGDEITTQGDANNIADPAVSRSDIKGVLAARIPRAGAVIRVLKNPICILLILAAAVFLLERSYRKEAQPDDEALERLKEEIRKLKEDRE